MKFPLDEHNPLKSNHQTTDVVKHLYTYLRHFMDFKNPEILTSAFNYRELLIKETLLTQEQPREMNVDNFSTSLYLFNTQIVMSNNWLMLSSYADTCFVHCR